MKIRDYKLNFSWIGLTVLLVAGCSATERTANDEAALESIAEASTFESIVHEEVEANQRSRLGIQIDHTKSLIDHLRQVPGLNINFRGYDYDIKMRGSTRFERGEIERALFVINRMPVGTSYNDTISLFAMENVKEINVYKGTQALRRFGDRGVYGVIEIITE